MSEGSWRIDPDLRDKFHADHPNDVQVMVHDGEPRRSKKPPEACWVQVDRVMGTLKVPNGPPDAKPPIPQRAIRWAERTVYGGKLLNQPKNLTSVRAGEIVAFVCCTGMPHPLMVSPAYRSEREKWTFVPCTKCGADQALDPPTTMARTRFPDAPAGAFPIAFTAFCPCGGTMVLSMIEDDAPRPAAPPAAPAQAGAKPWWKVW